MNTSDSQLVELDLSDTFHRIKRTVMLLSGSLILLGSSDAVAKSLDAVRAGLGLEHASPVMLRATLLVAMSYYFWGFIHQVLIAHRRNADVMDASALSDYESQVRAFVDDLKQHDNAVGATKANLASMSEKLPSQLDEHFRNVADRDASNPYLGGHLEEFSSRNIGRKSSKDPDVQSQLADDQKSLIDGVQERFRQAALEQIGGVSKSVGAMEAAMLELSNDSKRLQEQAVRAADRIRINKRMYRDRWFSFWVWECASTAIAYLLAVLFTLTTIGFYLAQWLNEVATV